MIGAARHVDAREAHRSDRRAGSAAATRSSSGPAPLSVGSDSDGRGERISEVVARDDDHRLRAGPARPTSRLRCSRLDAPPLVRSLVVYGKPPLPRSASVTARLVSKRSAPRKRSAWAIASIRGLAPDRRATGSAAARWCRRRPRAPVALVASAPISQRDRDEGAGEPAGARHWPGTLGETCRRAGRDPRIRRTRARCSTRRRDR